MRFCYSFFYSLSLIMKLEFLRICLEFFLSWFIIKVRILIFLTWSTFLINKHLFARILYCNQSKRIILSCLYFPCLSVSKLASFFASMTDERISYNLIVFPLLLNLFFLRFQFLNLSQLLYSSLSFSLYFFLNFIKYSICFFLL